MKKFMFASLFLIPALLLLAANPPVGYHMYIFPIVAHTTGIGGTNWKTDLTLINTSDSLVSYSLYVVPEDGTSYPGTNVYYDNTLPAHTAITVEDVTRQLVSAFSMHGSLIIMADTNSPVVASVYVYNSGTKCGLSEQPLRDVEVFESSVVGQDDALILEPITQTEKTRTNIGILQAGGGDTTLTLSLYSSGSIFDTRTITITNGTMQFLQVSTLFPHYTGTGYILVTGDQNSGAILWSSNTDNESQDSRFYYGTNINLLSSHTMSSYLSPNSLSFVAPSY